MAVPAIPSLPASGKAIPAIRIPHTHREMHEILQGRGKENAFTPSPGLKEFLLELKARDVKIWLVTSGLYEKAYPEILSAFRTLNMGDPLEFYDAIITAIGFVGGNIDESGTRGLCNHFCNDFAEILARIV